MSTMPTKDSLQNLVSGLGVAGIDKNVGMEYATYVPLSQAQLDAAFRGDWIARKAVCIPADDATKQWRNWQADKKQITAIEAEERRLGLQDKTLQALIRARLYGGAALIIGVDTQSPMEPLRPETIGKGGLSYIHWVHRHQLRTKDGLDWQPNSGFFGRPSMYTMTSKNGIAVDIHPSRVVAFIGNPVPDPTTDENEGWGDSILGAVDIAVKQVGLTSQGIAGLVAEAKVDRIKMPGFMDGVGTAEYRDRIIARMQLAATAKSIVNALFMDAGEEWDTITANFAGLPDILKLYLLIASGAVDIPVTRFLGQSAAGFSTGDSDLTNYYDNVSAVQRNDITPRLSLLDDCLIQSALGSRPPEIFYNWAPLWGLDEVARADVDLKRAQVFQIDVASNLHDPEELREARVNQLIEAGTYPGWELIEEEREGEDEEPLNEGDPAVQAGMPGSPTALEPQKAALNGAQIASLLQVVEKAALDDLPEDTVKAILRVAFPDLDARDIEAIIKPLAEFKLKAAAEAEARKAEMEAAGLVPGAPPPAQPGQPGQPPQPGKSQPVAQPVPGQPRPGQPPVEDAAPRTLFVQRKLLNAREVLAWAREQGLRDLEPAGEMHVTVAFSREPVDWMKMGEASTFGDPKGEMRIAPGGPRVVEALGPEGALVLHFASSELTWRHMDLCERGCSWDYEDYHPHVTLTYARQTVDVEVIEPYRGPLVFGPELFEEIKDAGTQQ